MDFLSNYMNSLTAFILVAICCYVFLQVIFIRNWHRLRKVFKGDDMYIQYIAVSIPLAFLACLMAFIVINFAINALTGALLVMILMIGWGMSRIAEYERNERLKDKLES
jgi:hypothetical protein